MITILVLGLLVCLVYPVSPAPIAAVPLMPPPILEPLQAGSPQDFELPPPSGFPLDSPDHTSISNAAITVASQGHRPLVEDSVVNGTNGHVVLEATWDPLDVPGFPTLKIKQTCLEFLYAVSHEHYGTITGPVLGGWNPDHNPREAYDYVYLEKDQATYVEVEFGTWTAGEGSTLTHSGSDDLDIFVWAPGVEHTYANSLVLITAGVNPEVCTFVAPRTGTYTIGIDYYSGVVPMGWRCYVYKYQALGGTLFDGRTAVEDTADIGFDGAFDVRLRRITGTSLDLDHSWSTRVISNVTFINFHAPTVTVLSPGATPGQVEGFGLVTINWSGNDINAGETLQYTVEITNDLGKNWKPIAYTTQESMVWDPASAFYGLPPTTYEADGTTMIANFLVRVNVTDGRYSASDTSDNAWMLFKMGCVQPPPLELYIVVLVGAIVVTLIIIDVAVFFYRRASSRQKLEMTSE